MGLKPDIDKDHRSQHAPFIVAAAEALGQEQLRQQAYTQAYSAAYVSIGTMHMKLTT